MQDEHSRDAAGQPPPAGPRDEAGLERAMELAEDLSDAVSVEAQDWPRIAAWARELARLAEGGS